MTTALRIAMLGHMPGQPRTMTLELDFTSDPICGRLTDERGTRPFSGWLELAAAIQSAVDGASESDHD